MDYVGAFLEVRRKVGNLVTSIKINTIEIEKTKYLELGKSGSLPVCDIPDVMPPDMKEIVISIDETVDNLMLSLPSPLFEALRHSQ